MPHVFVSHSRENSSTAFRLCDALRKHDVQTWLDVRDLEPGAEWNESVLQAIRAAAGFVFLIGPASSVDRYQSFEWQQVVDDEYYLDPSKPLIPVLIGQPDLPGFLKTRQSCVLKDPGGPLDEVAEYILKALADPAVSVDQSKLEHGRRVRMQALESLRQYSQALGEDEVRKAPTRLID